MPHRAAALGAAQRSAATRIEHCFQHVLLGAARRADQSGHAWGHPLPPTAVDQPTPLVPLVPELCRLLDGDEAVLSRRQSSESGVVDHIPMVSHGV